MDGQAFREMTMY